jgi:predicted nucleic acid-binding protein
LSDLLGEVNEATALLQRSATVPDRVIEIIDSFDSVLAAATAPEPDPHQAKALWQAALHAQKGLRADNDTQRRHDVRVALEQFRQVLRDTVESQCYGEDSPVRDVFARTVQTLAAPQTTVAELLGVSTRQLQRWLADDGAEPAGDDAARIRMIGRLVNQLRHAFTGPGVIAWFTRAHPVLGRPPMELLDDPLDYPQLLSAATAARAQTA